MNLLVTPAGTTPSSRGRRGVSRDDESVSPSSRPLSPDPARIERERTPQPRQHDSPPIPRGWSQEGEVETRRASPPRTDWSNSSLPGIASFSRNSSLSSTADPSFPPSKDLPLAIPSSVSSAWDRRDSTSSTISSWSSTDPSPSARESIDSRWSGAGGEAYRQQHDPFRRSGLGAETFPPPPSDRPSSRHSASSSSLALPIEALSHIRLSSPSLSHSSPSFAAPALSHSASNPNFGGGGGVFSMAPRTLPPLPPPPVSGKYTRALVGSLVTVAHRLVDEKGETGIFFLANEVSVRTEGFYRLRFCLMQVDNSARIAPSLILAETFSSPFQVHPESTYPGPSRE
ncbi:velvet factor-domain-containing protein [Mrakia frigida]|uniref:velvet factor-domain-containing protein n=1 Tax=Mrakia frigida TaxID=29902 RepID=UPI003FCBF3F2